MSLLWSTHSNARVFDWKELLEEWHESLDMPHYVQVLIENLKEACNPDSEFDPLLSQFLTYLNHEEAGLTWFLYELVTHRWMWADIRLDFVRDLVDEIENLDACFPRFPGSPWTSKTIRQWLNENLSSEELEVVQMMPPLEAPTYASYSYQTPQRTERTYEVPPTPSRPSRSSAAPSTVPVKSQHASMMFLLQREGESEKMDDKIYIFKEESYDSYTIRYSEGDSKIKFVNSSLSGAKVIDTMRKILRMLTIDEKPFEYLQVSLPSMPTILLKPQNLTSQARDLIYDSMEMTMDDWPITV
jgi:hypothetical protein